jgi:hypothetical protein
MKGRSAAWILLAGALAAAAPMAGPAALAGEIFRQGPVVCSATTAEVKGLQVESCRWRKAPDGGFYEGICEGSLAAGGKAIAFSAYGEARRTDYTYPDNNSPLDFAYQGLNCTVESNRLKTVQNCKTAEDGLSKACQICVITAGKVCFNIKFDITVLSTRTLAAAK